MTWFSGQRAVLFSIFLALESLVSVVFCAVNVSQSRCGGGHENTYDKALPFVGLVHRSSGGQFALDLDLGLGSLELDGSQRQEMVCLGILHRCTLNLVLDLACDGRFFCGSVSYSVP